MISVFSQFEMFTAYLGWQEYNHMFELLADTGLLYLMILGIFIANWVGPFKSQEAKSAEVTSKRRMLIDMLALSLALGIAGIPVMQLDMKVHQVGKLCVNEDSMSSDVSILNSLTSAPNDVRVPILWYGVMGVSHAITAILSNHLDVCEQTNMRTIRAKLDTTQIKNIALRKEIVDYFNQCYMPALTKFSREELDSNPSGGGSKLSEEKHHELILQQHDIKWLGSQYFLDTPGYYDVIYGDTQPMESASMISCKSWWEKPNEGLFKKLIDESPRTMFNHMKAYFANGDVESLVARKLIKTSFPEGIEMMGDNHFENKNRVSKWFGARLGAAWSGLSTYPKMYLLISALPMIQSFVLMGIYAFMGIMLCLCKFELRSLIKITFLIFTIVMLSYIWQWAGYIDEQLLKVLYQPAEDKNVFLMMGQHMQRYLVDTTALMLYLGLPMIWFYLASLVWHGINHLFVGVVQHGASSGANAGSQATSPISAALRWGPKLV